jgi:hypothetical protein
MVNIRQASPQPHSNRPNRANKAQEYEYIPGAFGGRVAGVE